MNSVRGILRAAITISSVVSLAACDFQESITPIAWQTIEPNDAFSDPRYSTLEPIPTIATSAPPTPTPISNIVPFRGFAEFDCRLPMHGDELYGYCRDALSDDYYVWAKCDEACPEWPYPGVEWRKVGDSSDLSDFKELIRDREDALSASADALEFGGAFASLDVVIAALGWSTAECIVGGEVTFGATCIRFVLAVAAAGGAAYKGFADSRNALDEAEQFEDAARGILEDLQP